MAIYHTKAFGGHGLKIVAFNAISVLVGFLFGFSAAVKFALYTRTCYLMVASTLVVNSGRYEGWVIIGVGIVMAY